MGTPTTGNTITTRDPTIFMCRGTTTSLSLGSWLFACVSRRMDADGLAGGVDRLNLGDAPEAGALAAAVASAAVGATSSPASPSGFSKTVDELSSNQGGPQAAAPGPPSAAHDKDNDVEGKLFIGGISWQTTEEGLR